MSHKRNQLGQRLGPGLWVDKEGNAHFSIPEILDHTGLPDTPENRDLCLQFMKQWLAENALLAKRTIVRTGDCPECGGRLQVNGDKGDDLKCTKCGRNFNESEIKE